MGVLLSEQKSFKSLQIKQIIWKIWFDLSYFSAKPTGLDEAIIYSFVTIFVTMLLCLSFFACEAFCYYLCYYVTVSLTINP